MSETPKVSLGFIGWMIAALVFTAVVVATIVVLADENGENVADAVGAALSPIAAIVGGVIGHHVGSRRVP
jgi:hypothetical protein